jgi:hypothetical protein
LYCKPSKCWQIENCKGCIILANDKYVNGNKIAHIKIGTAPYDDTTPYYMLIEQLAISKQEYDYWNIIKGQTNNSGGIFDTPPATAFGNMTNLKDKSEQVLGYFSVAGVNKVGYSLLRNGIKNQPFEKRYVGALGYIFCDECTPNEFRTETKPLNWLD